MHSVINHCFKNYAFRDFTIDDLYSRRSREDTLDKFVAKFPSYVAKPYLLWMKDRKTQAGVEYLPIYMAPCLAEA